MAEKSKTISLEWVLPESQMDEELAALQRAGGTVQGKVRSYEPDDPDEVDDYDSQFDPMTVVAVAVGVGYLIEKVSNVWLKHKRAGGQIIDGRGGKLVVRRVPYTKHGTLVFMTDQGNQVFETSQEDEGFTFLREFLGKYHG